MTRGRWITGGAVLLAATLVVGGLFLWRGVRAAQARSAECRNIQAVNDQRGPGPVGSGPTTLAVIGDSYAEGQELDDPLQSWPTRFGADEQATVWVYAVGGSGFSQSTYCPDAAYPKRAAAAREHDPRMVVVQGGLNDVGSTDAEIRGGLDATVAALPGAQVVIVGPPLAPQRDAGSVRRVDAALAAESAAKGVRYVSALGWQLTYGPDRLHPDVAGQQVFADDLAAALRG